MKKGRVHHKKKIIKCFGDMAQDEKIRQITTRTNNGHEFQFAEFSIIEFLGTNSRKLSSGTQPKLTFGKSSSC